MYNFYNILPKNVLKPKRLFGFLPKRFYNSHNQKKRL